MSNCAAVHTTDQIARLLGYKEAYIASATEKMYCHCTVCVSTFNGAVIPSKYEILCKCPDCGKKVPAPHTPAVRAATDEEIKEYDTLKRKQLNYMYEILHRNESLGAY